MNQFRTIIQKSTASNGECKLIMVSVLDEDLLGPLPSQIVQFDSLLLDKTIYTGTYPTIKLLEDTAKDIETANRGLGINGIIMNTNWYCKDVGTSELNKAFNLIIK